jgi:purine nucleosidase
VRNHFGAEFNFYVDPEAAHIVLHAFPVSYLVSWECTYTHSVPDVTVDRWGAVGTEKALFFHKICASIRGHGDVGPDYCSCDMIAAWAMLKASDITVSRLHVTVELSGRSRASVLIDHPVIYKRSPNAYVVTAVPDYVVAVEEALRDA